MDIIKGVGKQKVLRTLNDKNKSWMILIKQQELWVIKKKIFKILK